MPESAIEEYRVTTEPYYLAVGREVELINGRSRRKTSGDSQGPDWLRQDSLRGTHGVAT